MSFEILEKLETKVKLALETISLLQMELEDLKEENKMLIQSNTELKSKQDNWQERLNSLLGKIDSTNEELVESEQNHRF